MSDDLGRRGFLQGLLAALGGATLVRRVPASEMPALVEEATGEALEYDPGAKGKVSCIYASVSHSPLKLDKNFGFRYLSRGRAPRSIRLHYDVTLNHATVHLHADAANVMMVVSEVGLRHIEVLAYDTTIDKPEWTNFSVLVMGSQITS